MCFLSGVVYVEVSHPELSSLVRVHGRVSFGLQYVKFNLLSYVEVEVFRNHVVPD